MLWIECYEAHFKNVHTINLSSRKKKKSKFCKQGSKLDYSRYSQVSLLTLCYHWQTLRISYSLEMAIVKFTSYLSLHYFTYIYNLHLILIIKGIVIRTIHNIYVCMYINIVLVYISCV